MTKLIAFAFILSLTALLPSSQSEAAAACPGGMTASGKCVNPKLADMMRHRVIAFTQPKFSYSAPMNLPSEDGQAGDIPTNWHELYNLHTFPTAVDLNPLVCTGLTRSC